MFASGIAVLVNQKDHAALSSVPFQSAAVVILIAGILSIIAGSVEVIAMKCRECPPAEAKKYLLIVSNWEASCWFVKLRISIPSQIMSNCEQYLNRNFCLHSSTVELPCATSCYKGTPFVSKFGSKEGKFYQSNHYCWNHL